MVRWALRTVILWGGIGLVCFLMAQYFASFRPAAPRPVAPPAPHIVAPAASNPPVTDSMAFAADRRGHVFVDAAVDGAAVRFMVDTGASTVALTRSDAVNAGIDPARLSYNQPVATANGTIMVAPVTIREIRIGQLSVTDVPAAIVDDLQVSLLGMSFLTRLRGYEMRDGRLILNW